MKPISPDLRERIVSAYQRGEGSQAALAKRFAVGIATVQRLLRQYRETGSLQPKKAPGRAPLLSEEECRQVRQWIEDEPDLTQDELARRFAAETGRRVSRRTMGRVRAQLGFTRKKRP
ncbi:helix-turn-helix domain-containing protein [Rhodocaloribacter sp.]